MGPPFYLFLIAAVALILLVPINKIVKACTCVTQEAKEGGEEDSEKEVEIVKTSCCKKVCDKLDLKGTEKGLRWNFFCDFFYLTILEVSISLALQRQMVRCEEETLTEELSAYFAAAFMIMAIIFFVFLAIYLFAPCPGNPEDRLEKYED